MYLAMHFRKHLLQMHQISVKLFEGEYINRIALVEMKLTTLSTSIASSLFGVYLFYGNVTIHIGPELKQLSSLFLFWQFTWRFVVCESFSHRTFSYHTTNDSLHSNTSNVVLKWVSQHQQIFRLYIIRQNTHFDRFRLENAKNFINIPVRFFFSSSSF